MTVSSVAAASPDEPLAITLRHDSASGPAGEVTHFGQLGEPLAYTDWLCIEAPSDRGDSLTLDLRDISVMGDEGQRVGRFVSAGGNLHTFRAYPLGQGAERFYEYCAHIRPSAWSTDTLRFVPESDAHRLVRLDFAWRGDTAGCAAAGSERRGCGSLTPNAGGFAYGGAAVLYFWLGVSRAQSSYLGEGGAALGPGITRLRLAAYWPLLYLSFGTMRTFAISAEAGFALPVTVASTAAPAGGGVVGFGFGPYWAQCLSIRAPVAPRICAGAELDGAIEGATTTRSALDDLALHAVASWFVSVGVGAH
jgi:hypothetical protein